MAFEFVCPFCHSRARVDDRFAGMRGPCASCGKTVTIPGKAKASATQDPNQVVAGDVLNLDATSSRIDRSTMSLRILSSIAVVSCIVAVVFVVLLPVFRNAFSLRNRTLGLSNAKQIAEALNDYRRSYGCYPTPTVVDSSGKPLYSWRVLILPQLGFESLYNEYQLDQTWDSPTNIDLMNRMPLVYACPGNQNAIDAHETNFALMVGPGSLFPAGKPIDADSMLDKPSETLLVVETKDGAYPWTQPKDLDTKNGIKLGSRPMIDIGGNYPECAVAATVDNTPLAIKSTISQASLDAIITPNGEETVDLSTVRF